MQEERKLRETNGIVGKKEIQSDGERVTSRHSKYIVEQRLLYKFGGDLLLCHGFEINTGLF
jgi:hypothetical protein